MQIIFKNEVIKMLQMPALPLTLTLSLASFHVTFIILVLINENEVHFDLYDGQQTCAADSFAIVQL